MKIFQRLVSLRWGFAIHFRNRILKLCQSYVDSGTNVVLTGDFNTSHQEIDLANPKANKKCTGFLPHEREWIDRYMEGGLVDCFRHHYPEKEGEYTWWTYRNNCRERNIGWRLDYFMVNKDLVSMVADCRHRPDIHGSDHCPVEIDLKI